LNSKLATELFESNHSCRSRPTETVRTPETTKLTWVLYTNADGRSSHSMAQMGINHKCGHLLTTRIPFRTSVPTTIGYKHIDTTKQVKQQARTARHDTGSRYYETFWSNPH
jgi:hypothetical protein